METRNITLSLPSDLIKKAKVYAAEHDTTINAVVRELLQDKVAGESKAQAAVRKLLEIADRGPFSDFDPSSISRDELHERWK